MAMGAATQLQLPEGWYPPALPVLAQEAPAPQALSLLREEDDEDGDEEEA
jgi:hypothetical protein